MANILLNYQTSNLRYAVEELTEHNLYSWRALGNDFARKTVIDLHPNIKENIDIYEQERGDLGKEIVNFCEAKNIDTIFPLYNDMLFPYLYKKLGFTDRQAEILCSKQNYTEVARSVGISVPRTYTDIKKARYPLIAKPVNGTGSIGIKVLNDYSEYFFFASGEDIQYNNLGKHYIFQDFIQGVTVSSAGRIVDGELIVDCTYNIEMSELPYRAETGFVFAPNIDVDIIIKELMQKFVDTLELDTCAWMADFIYSNGEFVLVDFSPRLSVSAQVLVKHSANINYNELVLDSILYKNKSKVDCKKSIVYRYFNFPKGEYEVSYRGDKEVAAELKLPNEVSYMTRLDMLMPFKGYAVTVADYLSNAEKKWQVISDNIILRDKHKVS